jgi:hypothetical protein
MEFFRYITRAISAAELQRQLTLEQLPLLCDSIDSLLEQRDEQGEIYCLWGQFRVNRELINGGVRFSLPGCPNALSWSITSNHTRDQGQITIHCSINREQHDPDFIASIEQFVDDWQQGLALAPA